ncbi:hypothetical protein, partial [Actinacidiphila sp. bgisy167]|uniref:hypothetical protein n=1 Tax=Actinacidiphila sp. bgisy167 TaxID=3413797 RepID=UPI003D705814
GQDHAAAWLKRLGFQVKAVKNPDWARDEVILACHGFGSRLKMPSITTAPVWITGRICFR